MTSTVQTGVCIVLFVALRNRRKNWRLTKINSFVTFGTFWCHVPRKAGISVDLSTLSFVQICVNATRSFSEMLSASASSLSRLPARILPHDVSGRAPFISLNIDVNEHRAYIDIMSIIGTLSFMAMPISPTTENNLFCTDWYKYYRTHIYLWNTMYEYKIQCMIMM